MGKSNYPEEYDTSIEIPAVRDNILEVGSDAINTIRHAIFQIERTLGLNPQGAVGNTVSSRLDKISDGNGNILASALDRANVLSGPIIDADVSEVAAIKESKLKLKVPTSLLQSQLMDLDKRLTSAIISLNALNANFSVHVNSAATNRHPATAISVSSSITSPSATGAADLTAGSVQATFEEIYNAHINFDGENTAADENSHEALQIYFDNTNISGLTDADDVQEALEDIASGLQGNEITHQDLFHSNGILRIGKIDTPSLLNVGPIVASDVPVTFFINDANSSGLTTITFASAVDTGDIEVIPSDIITISDATDTDEIISGSYEIASVLLDASNDIISVQIFNVFSQNSSAATVARISKNINIETNEASLLVTVREAADLTSSTSLQICNPNAVRVVSQNIRPSEVTASNSTFNLSVDGGTDIEFDVYDNAIDNQTIDSVIKKINEQCAEQFLPVLSYRLDRESGPSELVIAHNLPDIDGDLHTLSISASGDNGLDVLGFAPIEDLVINSIYGNDYYISGKDYQGLGIKLDSTEVTFFVGTNVLVSNTVAINFLKLKFKKGDIVTITNSPSDDGTYQIRSVSATQLGLDPAQLPSGFLETSTDDTRFRVYHDIVSFEDLTFDDVNQVFATTLLDIFMNPSQEVFAKKRLEFETEISGIESLITIVDFRGDVANEQFTLTASEGTIGTIVSIDSGEPVEVYGKNSYVWVNSGEKNISFRLFIKDVEAVNAKIVSLVANIELLIYGYEPVNYDSNLLLARSCYGAFKGRVIGGSEVPRIIYKLSRGNVGTKEISSKARYELIERPLDELRASGVIFGLEVTSAGIDGGFHSFSVDGGICYVAGKRFEIEAETLITDIEAAIIDKIFISIDENGNLVAEASLSNCYSPFGEGENCQLATLEYDNVTNVPIDIRLFINELDLKLLNSITVSPQPKLGHFESVTKALRYAKRFNQMFPKAGTPVVHLKSGTYEITNTYTDARDYASWISDLVTDPDSVLEPYYDEIIQNGLFIDFPVNITGEGDTTILKIRSTYTFNGVTTYNFRGDIVIPGDRFDKTTAISSGVFNSGMVLFNNLKLDNCRISLVDTTVIDSLAVPLNYFIDLDNVVFDNTNFTTTPYDTLIGSVAVDIKEVSDTSDFKGNLLIRNCKFIESGILTVPNRVANLLVANNALIGDETQVLFIDELGVGNPFSPDFASHTSNITITGNIHTGNFNTTGSPTSPKMAPDFGGDSYEWGERFGRNVDVAANLNVRGSAIITSAAVANEFVYPEIKEFRQMYMWHDVQNPADLLTLDAANSSILKREIASSPSIFWTVCSFDGNDSAVSRVLDRLPVGCNISSIEIGVGTPTVPPDGWTIEIFKRNLDTRVKTSVWGPVTVDTSDNVAPCQVLFENIDIEVGNDNDIYYVRISNDVTVDKDVFYVKVILTFVNVSDALGVLSGGL